MEWYHFLIIAVGILVVLGAGFGLGVGYRKKVAEREIGSAEADRKSTRLNSSHVSESRMPSSA